MTRTERRLLIDTSILGVLLTAIVAALEIGGLLAASDRFFHDLRAKHCQFFTPPPTDQLVHLDIDDRTLEAMGAWPWPRNKLAELIDEINRAGPKALALDIILSERQPPDYEEVDPGKRFAPATRPVSGREIIQARRIDRDAALASAIRRFGKVIVPVSFAFRTRESEDALYSPVLAELMQDLELDREGLMQRLRSKGRSEGNLAEQVQRCFAAARQEAMFQRIAAEASRGEWSPEQLRKRLLPRTPEHIGSSPLTRLLEEQYHRFESVRALGRFARPVEPGLPPLLSTQDELATLGCFSETAASTGFVDYIPLDDGVVRSVPLWATHRDWMYPGLGLSLACAMLDVNLRDVRLSPDAVILPRAEGDVVIPVRAARTTTGTYGMFFDIPWFGTSDWERMYDYPQHQAQRQHMSVRHIWEACEVQHRIVRNNRRMDSAISNLLDNDEEYKVGLDPGRAKRYFASLPGEEESAERVDLARWTLQQAKPRLAMFDRYKDDELNSNELFMRNMLRDSCRALEEGLRQNDGLRRDLEQRRNELRAALAGKAALMGWVAVGAIADVVPTSLHTRCPGVVVHGAVFNAILTRSFWHAVPTGICVAITIVMGLMTTGMVAWLSPWKALAATAALAAGYLLINGLYLFDRHDLLLGVAGPITVGAVVWAGGTLVRYIVESSLRTRITRRFRSYVDPVLVDYVIENDAPLDGQIKELTVVFTDLGGFTTLTERLGERTVPLLNRYMGLMVPIIQGRRGYLNKFLGDGIMYFFGAPMQNPHHAYDAVASVLEMLEVMKPFNAWLAQEQLPNLEMRAGIASGDMVVGDAGPADRSRSDYTVLGDTVNLGARLEPANKVFGTRILINERARELVGDRILVRPIGKIQVVGKREGVKVYEPLSLMEQAGEQHRTIAQLSEQVVTSFTEGAFEPCLDAIARMEKVFGPSKLSGLYRGLCIGYQQSHPIDFDGQIVLTAK